MHALTGKIGVEGNLRKLKVHLIFSHDLQVHLFKMHLLGIAMAQSVGLHQVFDIGDGMAQ